jgi:acetyltransferase-like isoleucine patch superfamily enzyme
MRFILRQCVYFIIMCVQRIRYRNVIFEYGAKASLGSVFGGYNKLSHHAYLRGELGFASYIGAHSVVIGKIGMYCSIAENVVFLTKTHPVREMVSTHPCFYSLKKQCGFTYAKEQMFNEEPKLEGSKYSIEVGNDVYIGYGVTVIGPCRIGDGAVIAAGAIVTGDIPEYAIVGGIPAKIIQFRFADDVINYLKAFKWWNKPTEWIGRHAGAFTSIERMMELMSKEEIK